MRKRLGLALGGVLVGLVVAEGVFWLRDDGAFPHVNFYQADPELGVRLAPDSSERIAFGGNPTTTISTHGQGYRTPAWPAPSDGEVLIVGDSQVFGLGVEEDQSLAAHLSRELGRTVLNGGVPTYGPAEYLAVVDEVARERPLGTVVFVVNYSNDLFEVDKPNVERHAVWDGWAVRIENAPRTVTTFPGRRWLYSQSHLFFALRKWMHQEENRSLPSEGNVADLVRAAEASEEVAVARGQLLETQEQTAGQRYREQLAALDVEGKMLELFAQYTFDDIERGLAAQAVLRGADVGDIVRDHYAEGSRPVPVTAEMLAMGVRIRQNIRGELRAMARDDAYLREEAEPLLRARSDVPVEAAMLALEEPPWPTPLDATLDALNALAEEHGFTPVVVALPLDLQVLPSQFAKYGAEPVDMEPTRLLFDDLEHAGAVRGIRVARPLSALREVGDAAFLKGDLHLTSAGHAAVARVVAASITGPPPAAPPSPGIPEGRSRVPWEKEWFAAPENLVRGSTAARCVTHRIREWFRMDCRPDGRRKLVGLKRIEAPLETHGWYDGEAAVLLAPVLPGRRVEVDVIWTDRTERLSMTWDEDTVAMALRPTEAVEPEPGVERTLEAVLLEPGGMRSAERRVHWIGAGTECQHASCLFGTRLDLPECPEGRVNAGSAGHCFEPCVDGCGTGICTPWGQGSVCL